MKKSKARKPCYYCGVPIGQTGSDEHVPPQMMFKAGTDSITVPSCAIHNQDKHYRDAVIISFLIRSATKQWRGLRNIAPEVLEAFQESEGTIERLKKTHPDIPLISPLPEDIEDFPPMPFLLRTTDIYGWISQITAGLVYDAVEDFDPSIEWDQVGVISPQFVELTNPPFHNREDLANTLEKWLPEVEMLNSYYWFNGWPSGKRSPYPTNIYRFQISFLPDYVYFWHRFYDTFDWYIRFKPSPNTILKLKAKINFPA